MEAVQSRAGQAVCEVLGGRSLTQALEDLLRKAPGMPQQQRGALQDLSYGTLRYYGRLRLVLEQLLHKPLRDEALRCLLLVALYQLNYTRAPAHAVVDHAVRAARQLNAGAASLANAVLRAFLRSREALLAAADRSDEGRYSYPQWWIDAVRARYGDLAHAILLAGNQHPPMTLRVNRRRSVPEEYLALLAQQGMSASLVAPGAILLERPVPVNRLPGFADGLVSVQDAGAQCAAHLLGARDGMRVLDACAAPGGKCAHLLELAQVDLTALDKDASRLQKTAENLERLGLCAALLEGDAAQPGAWWDGKPFQRILADVPCSASGVVRRHPDIKWLRRPSDIEGFARQQSQILGALWRLLESDGKLLYATCSIFERENRQVVGEFLREHGDARLLETDGGWREAGCTPDWEDGQLLPGALHDGFYYAVLHKHG
jgi:16S rRNA (cytosine967-C5)-methyltransferase